MNFTNKQLEDMLTTLRNSLESALTPDGQKVVDVLLNDSRIMDSKHPGLKNKAIEIKQLLVPLFHMGGVNSIYNDKYREEILSKEYDVFKPWDQSRENNAPNGTDLNAIKGRPETELKSVKTNSANNMIYISPNTPIGEIDKVHTKVGENHPIYGVNTEHHFFSGIFDSTGSKPIILFYVNNEDFGRTIQPLMKQREQELRLKTENLTKKGRDSLALKLGMFLDCPSLTIVNIDSDWSERVVYNLPKKVNPNLYKSSVPFLGDKEEEVSQHAERNNNEIAYSFHGKPGMSEIKLYDLTVAEISGVSSYNTKTNKDLICGFYNQSKLVAVFKVPNQEWVPLIETQKKLALECLDKCKGLAPEDIKKLKVSFAAEHEEMQNDVIRSDTCRIKLNQLQNAELLYVNPQYKSAFSAKRNGAPIECIETMLNQLHGEEYTPPRRRLAV